MGEAWGQLQDANGCCKGESSVDYCLSCPFSSSSRGITGTRHEGLGQLRPHASEAHPDDRDIAQVDGRLRGGN